MLQEAAKVVERYDNTHYHTRQQHHLNNNVNAMASRRSTKANDEANGKLPETSLHRRNDHQGTRHKVQKVTAQDPIISNQTDTNQDAAKASHLANVSRHRVCFLRELFHLWQGRPPCI